MSKENVVKFYDEAKKNDKIKAEFENLQNELQKTEQVKDFDNLAEKIVYIGKKYDFDFSKEELNSYLEELKSNLTSEDLLNISGGKLSPRVAAIGMLGVLGISCIAGTAMKMSQLSSPTATQQEAVLSNEDNTDNGNKTAESEYKYDDENNDNDVLNSPVFNSENNPMLARAIAQQPSNVTSDNLLKNLFGNKRNDKVKNESPSLTVAPRQASVSTGNSEKEISLSNDVVNNEEKASPDTIVNKEEKVSHGIDDSTLDDVKSMFLDAEAEAKNIEKIKSVQNKGQGWVYVTLKDSADSFTITKDSLQYLAEQASMNVEGIDYIWVNNGNVAPTLSNDMKEIFSEPKDVTSFFSTYKNTAKRLTPEEKEDLAKKAEEKNNRTKQLLNEQSVDQKVIDFIIKNKVDVTNSNGDIDEGKIKIAEIMCSEGLREEEAKAKYEELLKKDTTQATYDDDKKEMTAQTLYDDDKKEMAAQTLYDDGQGEAPADSETNKDQTASKLADLNVKSAKKDGTWLMLTLENKDKGITITKDALTTLASAAGFKNIDDVQYINVANADVSPALGKDLQETFSEPGTVSGWFGSKYPNTMHRLSKVEALVQHNIEKGLAEFIVDNKIDVINPDDNSADMNRVSVAIIMRDNGVNENVAQLMKDGTDKEVAIIMDERNVDEDTAIEINKIAKVTSSFSGSWVYVTLKDGNSTLTINEALLEYLALEGKFDKADDVKAIHVNNGSVEPKISDDLKGKFTIEDYSSSYKNVAMRLNENEVSNDILDQNGIKKLRFDKSKNVVYNTMKANYDTLDLNHHCGTSGKALLNYIEELINVDIGKVYVGKNERDFNSENGNEDIKIKFGTITEDYAGSIEFDSGEDVLKRQEQRIEEVSKDENGNLTVTLNDNPNNGKPFEINTDVIKYLQKKAGMVGWFRTTPLKSLTVKKPDGTNAKIRVAQSIKDKYELVDGVLQAKN